LGPRSSGPFLSAAAPGVLAERLDHENSTGDPSDLFVSSVFATLHDFETAALVESLSGVRGVGNDG
jgi:hypothetical protein